MSRCTPRTFIPCITTGLQSLFLSWVYPEIITELKTISTYQHSCESSRGEKGFRLRLVIRSGSYSKCINTTVSFPFFILSNVPPQHGEQTSLWFQFVSFFLYQLPFIWFAGRNNDIKENKEGGTKSRKRWRERAPHMMQHCGKLLHQDRSRFVSLPKLNGCDMILLFSDTVQASGRWRAGSTLTWCTLTWTLLSVNESPGDNLSRQNVIIFRFPGVTVTRVEW